MREKFSISDKHYQDAFDKEVSDFIDPDGKPIKEVNNIVHGADNIAVFGEVEKKRDLINNAIDFAKNMVIDFQRELFLAIDNNSAISQRTKERVVELIKNNNYDKPIFKILADSFSQQEYFHRLGWEIEIKPDHVAMVFDFPKPISRYWQKDSKIYDEDKDEWVDSGFNMPWGDLYRQLVSIVWEHKDQQYLGGPLGIERINDIGEHQSEEYYYVWDIGENQLNNVEN